MAWDEWEQLKSDAADKRSAHMRLNQAVDIGDGGGDDLVVHDDELGQMGNTAFELRQKFGTDSDFARPSTFTASVDLFNDGLDMGSALTELHDAWNTQSQTLKEACAHISNHFDFTRAQHAKDEVQIRTGMRDADGDLMSVSKINEYIK
ncbi:hypothetical protein AB0K62_15330 [Streptomyces halstedii]|uniref:hypothetical protein n=1 Tax=Streptomyces TaxID=1883 RepID=UPI0004A94E69|nr:hypothetical protein [Streptomyces sp. NTK 937]KDQ67156.1 hypothetical protein DT87_07925 [Streptomyces sp. NTK 937]